MRPELELLLCCVQVTPGAATRERAEALLQAGLDWGFLRELALFHGVMPVLQQNLDRIWPGAVPTAVQQELASDFAACAQRSLFFVGTLLSVLDLLSAHGIAAMPFKGPVLAASAYGDLALRQFGDLDILVHGRNAIAARDLLVAHGFCFELHLNRAQEAAFLRDYSAFELTLGEGLLPLELHWRLAESYFTFPLTTTELWEGRQSVSLAGRDVPTFSPEDMLLVLCAHGCKHFWQRLVWICDVQRLIAATPQMDWAALLERATRLGCARMLSLGLILAGDLLDATLPASVEQRARSDAVVVSLAVQARDWLVHNVQPQPVQWPAVRFHLNARERRGDRVRYCAGLFFTPTPGDWEAVPLPPALFPLYYVLRPFRLIRQYGLRNMRAKHSGLRPAQRTGI